MNVYKQIDHLPLFPAAVITVGTFDGVHIGHRKVIEQLLNEARRINGTAVLITFDPHPRQVVSQDKSPLFLLNTPEEKYALLEKQGIEHIVVVPFDNAFASQSAQSYIHDFLVNHFHPHTIITGYDHKFGSNREGNYLLLEQESARGKYEVKEIPKHVIEDIAVSSTRIRKALLEGNIKEAAEGLGYRYFFSGIVVEGNKLGRTIGFPTANIKLQNDHKLVPANGVYAVDVTLQENGRPVSYRGMMNIGVRPTVDGINRMIEVNILDFDRDIYGEEIMVTLGAKLRNEKKFNGLDELKAQLAKDRDMALTSSF
jgi:riboflavin kinase/FMN adenylyltransferase